MPYTLVKGLVWVVFALLLGGVIGWLLRSLKSRRQIARARTAAGGSHAGGGPGDATELERLRLRLAELEPVVVERDRLRAELEPIVVERERVRAAIASVRPDPATHRSAGQPLVPDAPPAPDIAAAAAVLGREIELDDLRVVVGVGPAIESLCRRIGIRTWWDLATTETSLLRTMLTEARPGLAVDDTASWPLQARLLAEGRWAEFKALTEELAAGRPPD